MTPAEVSADKLVAARAVAERLLAGDWRQAGLLCYRCGARPVRGRRALFCRACWRVVNLTGGDRGAIEQAVAAAPPVRPYLAERFRPGAVG